MGFHPGYTANVGSESQSRAWLGRSWDVRAVTALMLSASTSFEPFDTQEGAAAAAVSTAPYNQSSPSAAALPPHPTSSLFPMAESIISPPNQRPSARGSPPAAITADRDFLLTVTLPDGTILGGYESLGDHEVEEQLAADAETLPPVAAPSSPLSFDVNPRLSPHNRSSLLSVLERWAAKGVIGRGVAEMGLYTGPLISIPLTMLDVSSAYAKRRNMAPEQAAAMMKEVKAMEAAGRVRKSSSPVAAQPLLVKKKDGSWRCVIDFRALNRITVPNRYPH